MHYLYKLKFPYGVHFGADKPGVGLEKISAACHSDTFFSAVCIEIIKLFGKDKLDDFVNLAKQGAILFSDLLPFKADELYIPKPIIFIEKDKQSANSSDSKLKKKFKKLTHIPITELENYCDFLKNGAGKNFPEYDLDFGTSEVYEKVAVSRNTEEIEEENRLYSVATFNFLNDCGLYFVAKFPDDKNKKFFDDVLKSLSYTGLGGKKTSGYGRFELYEDEIELDCNSFCYESDRILAKLIENSGKYYLTLSVTSPNEDEIDIVKDGYYSLTRRQGFVSSESYSNTFLKKIPTTMISAGSCFLDRIQGRILDVSNNGNHSVYRYGKPIMIGINL